MQSIYWVLTWACHRKCRHCYDDRFRPYRPDALRAMVAEGQAACERIIAHLPDDLSWLNPRTDARERTLLVLAGGELLIDGVRDELFHPALRALRRRYGTAMPKVSIQTTGDVLTPAILDGVLEAGVESIAIASIDDHHVGFEGDRKFAFMDQIRALMATRGVREVPIGGVKDDRLRAPDLEARARQAGPTFLFFGAQPDLWIGELWPRGRAFQHGLSRATYETNFCARWSGGKGFLDVGRAGSEVAIEPDGSVYPCCLKTRAPLGNLVEERLLDILDSVAALPAFQAINRGDPEAMGLADGWDRTTFRARSVATDGTGRPIENMCLGCDRFFEEVLGERLRALRDQRARPGSESSSRGRATPS